MTKRRTFVYQQYHDLLNREPDAGVLPIGPAKSHNAATIPLAPAPRRKDLSAAFYIELEFQETGYFVYRIQKASFGTQSTYLQFMADRSRVDAGDSGAE